MSTSSTRRLGAKPPLQAVLVTFLAGILTAHAFVAPFADADLVLCVGDNGHVAFELAQLPHHHAAHDFGVKTQADQSPRPPDRACRDLGLAGLNRLGPSPTPRILWTAPNPTPLHVDVGHPRGAAAPSIQQPPLIPAFPVFLLSTVLLI